jgi:hypothetical protein
MRFRKSNAERLAPASARRQGDITRLALVLLGRDAAIDFLNADNPALGARPLDLAIASEAGCAQVEGELRRMSCREDDAAGMLQ